jgi:hypothetical protein
MGSTADKEKDYPGPIKGQIRHPTRCDVCNAVEGNCDCSLQRYRMAYEEIRVPPAQWEKTPPCSITEQVVRDLKTRSMLGLQKYGVTLDRKDLTLRDFLQHAYEECLDQAKYLKRAIQDEDERNGVK